MNSNPKRRKNKYNPYELECSNIKNKYEVKFKDSNNKQFNIEVSGIKVPSYSWGLP